MKIRPALLRLLALTLLLAGCTNAATPAPAEPSVTPSQVPSGTPTITPSATPSAVRTPPDLPPPFQASFLYDGDTPHTYITDTCQYLHDRWDSSHAAPGTVVMVIMFHAIGGETGGDRISDDDFHFLMQSLYEKGFEAITTAQLADFMEFNAWIPERSVLLVVDDRRTAFYFDTFFREYQREWGWPVVNAWISLDDSIGRDNLPGNVALENEGWVDHQAHGVVHNVPMGPGATDEYIYSELQGSIDAFQLHFDKSPIAIIWPGGGFSQRPVEIARELGYRLGFTVNPRGPLMFNWVPLADEVDPRRPFWMPEGGMGDPLLVLPRYWDTDASAHLDDVVQMNVDAAAQAQAGQAAELEYYDIVCAPTYGPIP